RRQLPAGHRSRYLWSGSVELRHSLRPLHERLYLGGDPVKGRGMTVESIPVGTLGRRASYRTHQHGYALYEVLVALSIIGLIALGIFLAFRAGTTTWTTSQQFVAEQQNARILVNTIARGVRMIGYQYTGGGSAVINAAASDLSFYADMDGDGSMECYRYYLS